jgi:ribosomal protein L37AE/L43A
MLRCQHGVYMSAADATTGKAWGCQQCSPEGHPEAVVEPRLPRKQTTLDGDFEFCSCGAFRATFDERITVCQACGKPFADTDYRGRIQNRANAVTGGCPACGSTVHYQTARKGIWMCADCEQEYEAPHLEEDLVDEL